MEINENNKQEEIKEISKPNQKSKFVPSYQNKGKQNDLDSNQKR